MIPRTHGLILSLLLGAASAAGAYALIGTAKLTDAQTKPEVVSSRQIAKRARKLDAWEASLQKALAYQASCPDAAEPLRGRRRSSQPPALRRCRPSPTPRQAMRSRPARRRGRGFPRAAAKKPAVAVAAQTRDVDTAPARNSDRRRRAGAHCRRTRGRARGGPAPRHPSRPPPDRSRPAGRHAERAGATRDTIAVAVGREAMRGTQASSGGQRRAGQEGRRETV